MGKSSTGKKRGRRKYIEDYKLVGKTLVYTGDWYVFRGGADELRRHNYLMAALSICCCAVFVMAGFMRMSGLYRIYVLLPYVLSLMLSVLCLADTIKVWSAGARLNREQYERGVLRLSRSTLVLAALSAAAALGEGAFIIFVGVYPDIKTELTFLVSSAAACAASVMMFRQLRRTVWEKKK